MRRTSYDRARSPDRRAGEGRSELVDIGVPVNRAISGGTARLPPPAAKRRAMLGSTSSRRQLRFTIRVVTR